MSKSQHTVTGIKNKNFITNKNKEIKCLMQYASNQTFKIHDSRIFKSLRLFTKAVGLFSGSFLQIFVNTWKIEDSRNFGLLILYK